MLLRAAVVAVALAASGATAPLQCGHTPEAELREDETPGDALWAVAQKLHDRHDLDGERTTLKYLVERYPASRWVSQAKDELAQLGGAGDGGA
jgi:outer membrane protein assembly factor BamD (BamD/ComL family)